MGIIYRFKNFYGKDEVLDLYTSEDDPEGDKPTSEADKIHVGFRIHAEDKFGNPFTIHWDMIKLYPANEEEACDWTKPFILKYVNGQQERVYAHELSLRARREVFFNFGSSADYKKFTIRIPEELHRKAKVFAYSRGISLQDWVIALIEGAFMLEKAFPTNPTADALHSEGKD